MCSTGKSGNTFLDMINRVHDFLFRFRSSSFGEKNLVLFPNAHSAGFSTLAGYIYKFNLLAKPIMCSDGSNGVSCKFVTDMVPGVT